MLTVTGLTVRFGSTTAVDRLDLTVRPGELFVLLGGSGSGKTTLLRAIGGFVLPDAGRITFDGRDITALPVHQRALSGLSRSYQITSVFPAWSLFAS